jgi:hypothetical protein
VAIMTLATWVLFACGSSAPPDAPDAARDSAASDTVRLARFALQQGHPELAAQLYRQALERAWQRDEMPAIADLSYNLAVAELRIGHPREALTLAQSTRAELGRRGLAVPAELPLVELAAAYRAGDPAAMAAAQRSLATFPSLPPEVRWRAAFIRGLAAADRSDLQVATAALAELPAAPSDASYAGDRAELAGRVALLRGDLAGALASFRQAEEARRASGDASGVARALNLEAQASLRAGRIDDAADAYLRAGRAALLDGDAKGARRSLRVAHDLAHRAGDATLAAEAGRWEREAAKQEQPAAPGP